MTDRETMTRFEKDDADNTILSLLQAVVGTILLVAAFFGYSILHSFIVTIPAVMGAVLLFNGRAIFTKRAVSARVPRASSRTLSA